MAENNMDINYNEIYNLDVPKYEQNGDLAETKGALLEKLKKGTVTNSVINKLHLIKLAGDFPAMDTDLRKREELKPRSYVDLCMMESNAMQYDPDDFLYCKNFGYPINKLITLRRFPYPCTDNIFDKESQGEPDIARMLTYYNQEVNPLNELLGFSYKMKWKELESEMEQASMQGDQSGYSGFMKKVFSIMDPNLNDNLLRGENGNMYDPKHDQNKVYGPVDSIKNTHIRDVGLDFTKEFQITFEYNLKSINGRTPEYAMKDVIANILACTYNNGKFWPGSRYWVGERPGKFYQNFKHMNSDQIDKQLFGASSNIKTVINGLGTKGGAIAALKQAISGGFHMAMGKMLDSLGRPGIPVMNSLLSGEPTGYWHLTIGNPLNPILCIGNLICDNVEFSFPTDSLSYGEFPTKLMVKVNLKPGMSKDRAGIEMMFNAGRHRIYYAPKQVFQDDSKKNFKKLSRSFFGFDKKDIDVTLEQAYDFVTAGVKSVTKRTIDVAENIYNQTGASSTQVQTNNSSNIDSNKSPELE